MIGFDDLVPFHLRCCLTQKIFTDPVITPDGNTYERSAIEEHIGREKTEPLSGKPLTVDELIPMKSLQQAAEDFRKEQENSMNFGSGWWDN